MNKKSIKIRAFMILVAICSITIWCGHLIWRWQHYLKLAHIQTQFANETSLEETYVNSEIKITKEKIQNINEKIKMIENDISIGSFKSDIDIKLLKFELDSHNDYKINLEKQLMNNYEDAKKIAAIRDYHSILARKYRAASEHPWISGP